MGILGRLKGWFFGKRQETQTKALPGLPKQESRQTVVYEDDSSPPEIDEYAEVEITKPGLGAPARAYGKTPTEGTTMVKKKKATRKKTTKRKTAKKRTTRRKTSKKKSTRRKSAKRKKR